MNFSSLKYKVTNKGNNLLISKGMFMYELLSVFKNAFILMNNLMYMCALIILLNNKDSTVEDLGEGPRGPVPCLKRRINDRRKKSRQGK